MNRIKEIIETYVIFAIWILMCFLMIAAVVGCIAAIEKCAFFGVCGLVGSIVALLIFIWEAWGEWLDARSIK